MTAGPHESPGRDVLDLLDAWLALDDAARDGWMTDLAAREPQRARQLRELLAGAERLTPMDDGPRDLARDLFEAHTTLPAGTQLGHWRVLELLGSGGMGRVYLAERADGAFDMRVAIKVLRPERRLPDAIIEHERATLARLDHLGATRLLDGGISAQGDAFLVMELAAGQSLDDWQRERRPDVERGLRVFEQILAAVAHAHRQLIVHGDLKPDNIRVDDEGRVKVLDFGVARLLNATGPQVASGQTPGWTPPERQAGAPSDVAADIHNLGLLLARLVGLHDAQTGRTVAADLRAIVARATALDPAARYASVEKLADDVRRHRERRPVAARRGGRGYVAGRFVQRHRVGVGLGMLFAATLAMAAGVIWHQEQLVRQQRDAARVEAARAQTVLDYLVSLLGEGDDGRAGGEASLRSILNNSLDRIETQFAAQPGAHKALLTHLGDLLVRLNDYRGADKVLSRAVAIETPDVSPQQEARALDNLAVVRVQTGDFDAAEAYLERGMALLARDRADTRGVRSELLVTRARVQRSRGHADDAIRTLEEALELRLAVSPPESAQVVVVRNGLAASLLQAQRQPEALQQYRAIEAALLASQRDRSLDAAIVYANHAGIAFSYGRDAEAGEMFERALALHEELYGDSSAFAALLGNASKLDLALGRVAQARARSERAVAMMARFNGADSVDAALMRLGLGNVARAEGRVKDAVAIYTRGATELAALVGEAHPLVRHARAGAFMAGAASLPADDPAFDAMLEQLGAHPSLARIRADVMCERGIVALEQRRADLARASAAACLDWRRAHLDPESAHVRVARYLDRLAGDDTSTSVAEAWQPVVQVFAADHPERARLQALQQLVPTSQGNP